MKTKNFTKTMMRSGDKVRIKVEGKRITYAILNRIEPSFFTYAPITDMYRNGDYARETRVTRTTTFSIKPIHTLLGDGSNDYS